MRNDQNSSTGDQLDTGTVEARVMEVERSFEGLLNSHRKGVKTAKIVAVVVPLFVLAYLSYIYVNVSAFFQPEALVDTIEGTIQGRIPFAVEKMQDFATEDVPELAGTYMAQGEAAIPGLRKQIETAALEYSAQALHNVTGEVDRHMAKIIHENNDLLKEAFDDLAQEKGGEALKEALKHEVERLLDEEFGKQSVVTALARCKRPLQDVKKKLEMLKDTPVDKLTEEQALERRLIVLSKALLQEIGRP